MSKKIDNKNNENYFELRDERNVEKIRDVLSELPDYSWEFFVGIQMRTSVLTRLNYAYDLRIFYDYLSKNKFQSKNIKDITMSDIDALKAFDIEMYLDYLSNYKFRGKKFSCGENAKERKLCSLRSYFKYFYKKEKLKENISCKVDLPKLHDKTIIRLEKNEINELLNLAETANTLSKTQQHFHRVTQKRDVALLTLFLGTGIRISECVGLNRDDIDLKTNSFKVTRKGGNISILYFSDEVNTALTDYLVWIDGQIESATEFGNKISGKASLFFSLQGNRLSVRAVEVLVKKYSRVIAPLKKITPHKLRSTFGTELYRATQDIYVVADVLGHNDINTTKKHYAAMSEDIRKKAANIIKLKNDD